MEEAPGKVRKLAYDLYADLSALNKGNFTEDKVNDLKLYGKVKKTEREMYFQKCH